MAINSTTNNKSATFKTEMATINVKEDEQVSSSIASHGQEVYSTDDECTGQKKSSIAKDKDLLVDFNWEKIMSKIRR